MNTHTISLPIAKRLRELNVPQNSMFVHHLLRGEWFVSQEMDAVRDTDSETYSAFLASELSEILPKDHKNKWLQIEYRGEGRWVSGYGLLGIGGESLVDTLGKLLIHLLEQGIITLPST